jgi:hypothetical protein
VGTSYPGSTVLALQYVRLIGFCEMFVIRREPETMLASSFLVIQTAADRPMLAQSSSTVQSYGTNPSSPQPGLGGQTGRGASVVRCSVLSFLFSVKFYVNFQVFLLVLLR